jgi:redox-sensitive bicupin YhaK (pirin superfamily)
LLQIWIYPEKKGLEPGYEQTRFAREDKLNRLRLVGSRDGRDGSVTIHQDVNLYASVLETGNEVTLELQQDRKVFVQIIAGEIVVNGRTLSAGDGAQIEGEESLQLSAVNEAEFLVFDMGQSQG